MLKTKVPPYTYDLTTYPNLDPSAVGLPIPERYGMIYNIKPICIDQAAGTYKLNRRGLHSIVEIREAGNVLVSGVDYIEDLADGEFTVNVTPILQPNTTYYFVLESNYAIDGVNYIGIGQQTDGAIYADGTLYYINAAGAWSDQSKDLQFRVYGKTSLDAAEFVIVDNWVWGSGWSYGAHLRATVANTRIAQSFKTPATGGPWYLSRIHVEGHEYGAVSSARISRASILTAYAPAEIQLGTKSYRIENYTGVCDWGVFPQRGAATELEADIEGIENPDTSLMTNVADIIADIYTELLGGTLARLNAADLVALEAARTEILALNLDAEQDHDQIISKLETGQLWKYIPQLDGTFGLKYAASGEPAGTPHYRDEHFLSFRMFRLWSSIYERVRVKYAQDGGSGEYSIAEALDESALYFYHNQRTLDLETFLTDEADALQLAEDYLGTDPASSRKQHLSAPLVGVTFELGGGLGQELRPMNKVKLTRVRAMTATGSLDGVLFLVTEVEHSENGNVVVTAILDTMTY
ncbi:MAG: hypothetical protein M0R06_11695 [Sphaerochaeta sp.]|jgi:hypothetical protein|nr:hypothetical protein [Sphaerochaeta sp.]